MRPAWVWPQHFHFQENLSTCKCNKCKSMQKMQIGLKFSKLLHGSRNLGSPSGKKLPLSP